MQKTAAQKFYEEQLRGTVDQKPEAVRNQVGDAFDDAPESAVGVDTWFVKHFHKAPVSHDTAFYNQLHLAKEELKKALTPPEAA